jgi:serine/threonine protein kinase
MNSREFKERYLFDTHRDLIAEGTYSRVFHATDALLQRDICVKLFRKELIAGSPLIKELSRAGVFFHPNICAFYDLVEIDETNVLGETEVQPIGIMEYMNGGVITDYIARHQPDMVQKKKFIKDILKGLSYLHSIGKAHLDIKPGNILVRLTDQEPVVKIADFLNSENLHTRAVPVAIDPQPLSYKAPECFDSSYGEPTFTADIWSLGVIVYEIISGHKLFWDEGDTVEKTIRNVCFTDYWSSVHDLPEPYLTFVKKCLVRNATERKVSLEELTLILDGFKTEEDKHIAPTIAAPIVIAAPMLTPEPPIEMPQTPASDTILPEAKPAGTTAYAQAKERSLGLSIPIIAGALFILAGISAFIWKIVDDRKYATQATPSGIENPSVKAAPIVNEQKTDTPPKASTTVIHDTIRVVQIQQTIAPATFTPPVKAALPAQTGNTQTLPKLPGYDYLTVSKPYYFDLKTPLSSDEEFQLYGDGAAITSLGKNTFYVKPLKTGSLDIMVLNKTTHAVMAERVYYIKEKSTPIATIGDDITGGFVSPKVLLAKLSMQAKSESGSFKIKSFRMTCKSGACDIDDVSNNGTFNESMIKFLHNVKSGEKLYFDNIVAEDETGQPIKLNPFQITTY